MADGAEAEALAAHADLVLVVVKANETEVGDVRHLIERVENGRNAVGVVLNMVG
jgi:Mrp family chromosome partitioning ATPase